VLVEVFMLGEELEASKEFAGRGGRALLTGLVRCGRCARMMQVAYGRMEGHAHRYQCRGDHAAANGPLCIGIGGVRVDRAIVAQLLEAVAPHAIEAALEASARAAHADDDVRHALCRQLEEATYEASLAARRHQAVDPDKRLVARELEARWEATLAHVRQIEQRTASRNSMLGPGPVRPSMLQRCSVSRTT
jgi:Recombinase zinc beta ribbon domain